MGNKLNPKSLQRNVTSNSYVTDKQLHQNLLNSVGECSYYPFLSLHAALKIMLVFICLVKALLLTYSLEKCFSKILHFISFHLTSAQASLQDSIVDVHSACNILGIVSFSSLQFLCNEITNENKFLKLRSHWPGTD